MAQTFSLTGFASFLGTLAKVEHVRHSALEQAAQIVEDEARRVIGTYDYQWPRLAASTLRKKKNDTPLLETGKLRDSISHIVEGHRAQIGTNEKSGLYAELGTKNEPPRSFRMGAAVHKTKEILEVIGEHYFRHLSGGKAP